MMTNLTFSTLVDCDNAPQKQVIQDFNIAFAQGHVTGVLTFLTEEVKWDIVSPEEFTDSAPSDIVQFRLSLGRK